MSRIDDGFSTTISFASNDSVYLYEKEVTPPGIDGGDEIDTTTMLNTAWRTRQPRSLKTLTECSAVVAYDPAIYDDILDMLNDNQLITITFPDTATLAFWGWLKSFTPNACVEGEQPTANIVIVPSNQADSGSEVAPDYTAAS